MQSESERASFLFKARAARVRFINRFSSLLLETDAYLINLPYRKKDTPNFSEFSPLS